MKSIGDSIKDFLFVGIVCGIAAFGYSFLPPDDYQPSRPIYAGSWLVVSLVLVFIVRRHASWLSGASKSLVAIFAFLLLISFLM